MGVVFRARQMGLNRIVAVKMILHDDFADAEDEARFLREAEAAAAVRHPHVVQVYEFVRHDDRPYLVMEHLPGGSLAARFRAIALTPTDAAVVVAKVARGVQAAHDRGIIHRDLKPANILFDAEGEPKVVDFGMAKSSASGELTNTRAILGTPGYMAPEQAAGGGKFAGPPADVYALGVILYEGLTGAKPFDGDDTLAVLQRVIHEEPDLPRRRVPNVPRELEAICMKCLEKDPVRRYRSADELADDLDRFRDGLPVKARGLGRVYRLRKKLARSWRVVAAIALAGGVAALMATSYYAGRPGDDALMSLRRQEVTRRVEVARTLPPPADLQSPHPEIKQKSTDNPGNAAFRILEDERTFDMRGWKPLRPGDDPYSCVVVHGARTRMSKTQPVEAFYREGRTSGAELFLRCLAPKPEAARLLVSETPVYVGNQEMKWRLLRTDVSGIPPQTEFEVRDNSTYIASLQNPDERWFGIIGYGEALKTSLLLLFPEGKPYKTYELRVAPTRKDSAVPFAGARIAFEDPERCWLYWEIPTPEAGKVYRVDWTW